MKEHKFPKIGSYFDELISVIHKLDMTKIQVFCGYVYSAWKHDGTIYICGNGGSAALASRMAIDLQRAQPGIKVVHLIVNSAEEIIRDFEVFSCQLSETMKPDDLVIGISNSGTCANVFEAIWTAKWRKCKTAVLTGFAGEKVDGTRALHGFADHEIVVPSNSASIVNDVHNSISHIISHFVKERN